EHDRDGDRREADRTHQQLLHTRALTAQFSGYDELADPLDPHESAATGYHKTQGIPVSRGQGFALQVRREQRLVDLRAIERPSMTGDRDDLELARVLGAVRCEQFANPRTGPELLAPPSAGAVEQRRHLLPRQGLDLRIRELGRVR